MIDDDDDWLNAPLTPEERAQAERAAFGPVYDMNTLEKTMRTWPEVQPVFKQAVIMVLCEEVEIHRNFGDVASHTPVGNLPHLQERQYLMADALVIAMKCLHSGSIEVSADWLCVDPAHRELVFLRLLDMSSQGKRKASEIMRLGLAEAATRTGDLAEAAYVAAVTLGYAAP